MDYEYLQKITYKYVNYLSVLFNFNKLVVVFVFKLSVVDNMSATLQNNTIPLKVIKKFLNVCLKL